MALMCGSRSKYCRSVRMTAKYSSRQPVLGPMSRPWIDSGHAGLGGSRSEWHCSGTQGIAPDQSFWIAIACTMAVGRVSFGSAKEGSLIQKVASRLCAVWEVVLALVCELVNINLAGIGMASAPRRLR